jgi:CheY-like chemotaxis protein
MSDAPVIKALVVEDDLDFQGILGAILQDEGFEVLTANCVNGAKSIMEAVRLDVVVSDVYMPGGLNGLDLLRHLRESFPAIPVILMTGYIKDFITSDVLDFGARTLLFKPFRSEELIRAIRADCRIRPAASGTDPFAFDSGGSTGIHKMLAAVSDFSASEARPPGPAQSGMGADRRTLTLFAERMLILLELAEEHDFPEVLLIARLAEEVATRSARSDNRLQHRKGLVDVWDALTTMRDLILRSEEDTRELRDILIGRLQATLKELRESAHEVAMPGILSMLWPKD